ncbi:MAG: hypothetical protein IJZ57_04085 [Clostridia bacterium]|nr:hypothetical protein [Clostridia bacterium]
MKNSSKTALSGMAVAFGTVVMLLASAIPTLEYAVPAFAGFMILFVLIELGVGWAAGAYVATSLLGVFIVPNKEAVGMYIALFGLYPIVKFFVDRLPKIPGYIVKTVFFSVMAVGVYYVMIKVFGIASELLEDMNNITLPLLLVFGLAAFLVYDYAMSMIAVKYKQRLHRYVVKMFKRR